MVYDLRDVKLGKIYPFSNFYIVALKRFAVDCGWTDAMIERLFRKTNFARL